MTMFSNIADSYDRLNRIMTCGLDVLWRRWTVAMIPQANHILDLACGTGDMCVLLRKRFPTATVRGVDISEGMLALARKKCDGVSFELGDVLQVPWGKPDVITCAFGFRNFPNIPACLERAYQVLPTGGICVVLELWRPGLFKRCFLSVWLWFCTCVFVRKAKAEYRYLQRSILHTLSREEFRALALKQGFNVIKEKTYFPNATVFILQK